ncbi:unnamed protein product [Dovyalis caffra]|uniref:Uncharacterized protein n=1 Tax=Dovyalis caffra TaxID=77055 RepID=A0AAV1RE75_9ROSI|nr:unnamed protein product [Dovyalis caffra]
MFSTRSVLNPRSRMQLHDLVSEVRNAIKSTIKDCAKASTGDDTSLMRINGTKEMPEALRKDGVEGYMFSISRCRFPTYEADFGFKKPYHVSNTDTEMECLVSLMNIRDGEGIEAWLSLDERMCCYFNKI